MINTMTYGRALVIFFRKAVFSKALSYDIVLLTKGGLVLKLRAFKIAFLTLWLCTGMYGHTRGEQGQAVKALDSGAQGSRFETNSCWLALCVP